MNEEIELGDDNELSDDEMPPLEDVSNPSKTFPIDQPISLHSDTHPNQTYPIDEPIEYENEEWTDILGNGKLKKKVLKKGSGIDSRPTKGCQVVLKLGGTLQDGSLIDNHDNFSFFLNEGDVISAIDLTAATMELGECAILETDPKYAYGKLGRDPDVPANASIVYDLEVLSISPPLDLNALTIRQRVSYGDQKRERGNYLYSRNEYSSAIHSYDRALTFLAEELISSPDLDQAERDSLQDMFLKCCNNLAAAQLKISATEAAIKSCDAVLRFEPHNVKALFRRGKALVQRGDVSEAIQCYRRARQFDPTSKVIVKELRSLIDQQKINSSAERELAARMLKDMIPPDTTKSGAPWYSRWSVVGGAAVALTAVALSASMYMQRTLTSS